MPYYDCALHGSECGKATLHIDHTIQDEIQSYILFSI